VRSWTGTLSFSPVEQLQDGYRLTVAASDDDTKLLEFGEVVLDQMPPFVDVAIEVEVALAVCLGWDRDSSVPGIEFGPQPISIESLVTEQVPKLMSSVRGGTPIASRRWPGSSAKRTRLPRASTRATILVVRPPRERPMA